MLGARRDSSQPALVGTVFKLRRIRTSVDQCQPEFSTRFDQSKTFLDEHSVSVSAVDNCDTDGAIIIIHYVEFGVVA